MATDKFKFTLFALLFLSVCVSLFAQNEPRLTQMFSWSGGEYAFRYEVIFERQVDSNYVSLLREFTSERSIEVSLPVGDYRFRVIPYDILDKPSSASEWRSFKIIPVPQPDEETELEFIPDYEPELEPEPVIVYEPEPEPEIEPEPEKEIVKNPYALKPVIFNAGAIFAAQFPFYGSDINENISIISFGARLSVLFKIPLEIYIGPELTVNFYQFLKEYNLFFGAPGINLTALKWLSNERIAFGVRLGGMYMYYEPEFNAENLMPSFGAMFCWRISPVVSLEIGVDYFHLFKVAPGGYIHPWIGMSIQL